MNYTLPIFELFFTVQGEGCAMGMPAFFVRTHGCPIHCHFCDSAGTWSKDWVPAHIPRLTPEAIVQAALVEKANMVVVTGGEPTIFDLAPLVDACHGAGMEVHLETSGAYPIQGDFDWITVSPKKAKLPLEDSVNRADEFKFIIEQPEDITFFTRVLLDRNFPIEGNGKPIWLHPEWSQRENKTVLKAIVDAVKRGKGNYRAGWQIHKLYQADAFDARSRPLVPLGGVLEKGY